MNANYRIYGVFTLIFLTVSIAPSVAQTCSDNGGASPWVCVDKSGSHPIEGTDFEFDFGTDADNPGVTLITGDHAWFIWSQVSETNSTPDNLGVIEIRASGTSNDYEVSIESIVGEGAANVGSIVLSDTSWTGYSSIEGGTITGDLLGNLEVVEDSGGDGGELLLTIEGDVASGSKIVAHSLKLLHVEGDMDGDVETDFIDPVGSGGLFIDGDLSGDVNVIDELDGTICIEGNVSSTASITIDDFLTGIIQTNAGTGSFAGDLIINDGIPAGEFNLVLM